MGEYWLESSRDDIRFVFCVFVWRENIGSIVSVWLGGGEVRY